jgi:hypothetical protein
MGAEISASKLELKWICKIPNCVLQIQTHRFEENVDK